MPVGPAIVKGVAPLAITQANTRDVFVAINARGQAGSISVHHISSESMPVAEVVGLPSDQRIVAAYSIPRNGSDAPAEADAGPKGYLFMATRNGVVKRVTLVEVARQIGTFPVMNVAEDDELVSARLTEGGGEVILVTAAGKAIRFPEEEVRAMGLPAGGVAGIRLQEGDRVAGADVVRPRSDLLIMTDSGHGKRSSLADFPVQGRAGQGVMAAKLSDTDRIVGAAVVQAPDQLAVVTSRGKARLIRARSVKSAPRANAPGAAYHLSKADSVAAIVIPVARFKPLPPDEAAIQPRARAKPAPDKSRTKPGVKPKRNAPKRAIKK
jgi:DNA gyrase subunit A